MRTGESATCPKCDEVVVVPGEGLVAEGSLDPLVAEGTAQRTAKQTSRREQEVARAAATWLPRMGVGILAAMVLLYFICLPEEGKTEAVWFVWLPFLFLAAVLLIALGFAVGALNGIRHELRAMRKERDATGS
jgi:uncharacterized membrane protein